MLGLTDPNVSFPGLCANVRALPLVDIPRLPASASGFIATQYFDFTLTPPMIGVTIYSQFASMDLGQPGLPLTISNGRMTTVPVPPTPLKCAYHFAAPTAVSATVFAGMGVIVRLSL